MCISRALAGAVALLALSGINAVVAQVDVPVMCSGKEVPFTAGRYIVQMKGKWTRDELNEVATWLDTQGGSSEEYFKLNSVVTLISMISGQFSYNAMRDLSAQYGEQIEMVECDGIVTASTNKLYCRATMLKEPLPGSAEYTVNVLDSKSLEAVKKQLGDLDAIEYKDAEPSPAGSPQFTAKLSSEQIQELLASPAGMNVNFLQCTTAAIARNPLPAGGSTTGGSTATADADAAVGGSTTGGSAATGNADAAVTVGAVTEDTASTATSTEQQSVLPGASPDGDNPAAAGTEALAADDSSATQLHAAAVILVSAAIGLCMHQ